MSTAEKTKQIISKIKPHALRIIYILFIISFFMPYATVTGCSTKKVTDFTGIDMLMYRDGIIYIIPILIFIIFLVLSFVKLKAERPLRLQAFMFSWKALMASLAGIIIGIFPQLQFLFDDFEPRIGLVIAVLCCFVVFSESMEQAILYVKKLKAESGMKLIGDSNYSRIWYAANWIIIACSIALVPFYFYENVHDIYIAFILLIFITMPFLLSQLIVIAAVVKNEPWSIRWSKALLALFILMILSILYSSLAPNV